MNGSNGLRYRMAVLAAALALAAASSMATAAEGGQCVARAAGPQGATVGQLDAKGRCIARATAARQAQKAQNAAAEDEGGLQASAQCRDLSFSYSKHRGKACASHGGVLEWLAQQ